jgi:hypothetical protein
MLYESICLSRRIVFCTVSSRFAICIRQRNGEQCIPKHYLKDPQALSTRYIRCTNGSFELSIPFQGMYPQALSKGSE